LNRRPLRPEQGTQEYERPAYGRLRRPATSAHARRSRRACRVTLAARLGAMWWGTASRRPRRAHSRERDACTALRSCLILRLRQFCRRHAARNRPMMGEASKERYRQAPGLDYESVFAQARCCLIRGSLEKTRPQKALWLVRGGSIGSKETAAVHSRYDDDR
jgi:hypothetical protein